MIPKGHEFKDPMSDGGYRLTRDWVFGSVLQHTMVEEFGGAHKPYAHMMVPQYVLDQATEIFFPKASIAA